MAGIPPLLPTPHSSAMPPPQPQDVPRGGNDPFAHQRHIQPLMQQKTPHQSMQTQPREYAQHPRPLMDPVHRQGPQEHTHHPRPLMDSPQRSHKHMQQHPRPLMDSPQRPQEHTHRPRPLMDPLQNAQHPPPLMDRHPRPLLDRYPPSHLSPDSLSQHGALLPRPSLYSDHPSDFMYVPPHRKSPSNVRARPYPQRSRGRGRGFSRGRGQGQKRRDSPFDDSGSKSGPVEGYYNESMFEDPWAKLVSQTGLKIDVWGKVMSDSPGKTSEESSVDPPSQTEEDSSQDDQDKSAEGGDSSEATGQEILEVETTT